MRYLYIAFFVAGILTFQSCKKPQPSLQPQAQPFPVAAIPIKTVTGYSTFPAAIEGTVNSDIRAKVNGYITDVLVDEGEFVKKGQVLFRLETQALSQDAGAAKASVDAAQVEVDRLVPLVEKNIISNVQLETAKARLAQAQSAYNGVIANIDYANIRSSVDGYVGAINYRQGALVSAQDPRPLTTVSATEEMYVFFSMNERDYLEFLNNAEGETREDKIQNVPEVELQLVNGAIYSEKGRIETVTGQVNRSTGTVNFRASFPNPAGLLANGSSGIIRIPTVYEDVLVVPEIATFERQGKYYVYQVQGDTLAVNTPIEVTTRINPYMIVASGLVEGDQIVIEGVGKLRGPTPVIPQVVAFDSIVKPLTPVFK